MIASPNPTFHTSSRHSKAAQADALLAEYLDTQRGFPSFATRASAARHFLYWLRSRRISIAQVGATVVERFARHQCRCQGFHGQGYSPQEAQRPGYITNVRRFVAYLEDRGAIPVPEDHAPVAAQLPAYGNHLILRGYSRGTRSMLSSAAEHFVHWLRLSRIQAQDVDGRDVERFAQHDCRCFLCRKHGTVTAWGVAERRRGASALLQFLRDGGLVPPLSVTAEDPRLTDFRAWLVHRCGVTKQTVVRYLAEATRWLPSLDADPGTYDAITIRNVVLDQPANRSHKSVQLTAIVLRSYLRYLAANDACRPELIHAVPFARGPRNAGLPRFLSPATIEQIIASCDASTPAGLRDRAIILLLARLGMRAGDICQLGLSDIDWTTARLRVAGKSRRAMQLPLPQDAGDALLAYIEQARPSVREDHVFLRLQAPQGPLKSSAIACLVAKARARAGIEGGPTGSHVFRHSLATSMVRAGASLEAVGAILRHQSPETTAIYAKVDVTMLARVAQPWPGGAPC
ncbi:site-specific integrase [Ottowia sp.]|uniref:site-specific integrase n=1 Tax=Ottowia sp. TaxID=1898956 RepID=UPI0025CDA679|nr:site-specific integrase [Ottowia sp.]MBK6745281.1 tyrosine-type recombinase/integrase [Ottowia sp.]MBK6747024.1 tyrosine-type recombinase/integrase [Ottowia sp.]MBK6747198.1 tyrosine-type recombinase/integrase [Ottowia sp.]